VLATVSQKRKSPTNRIPGTTIFSTVTATGMLPHCLNAVSAKTPGPLRQLQGGADAV